MEPCFISKQDCLSISASGCSFLLLRPVLLLGSLQILPVTPIGLGPLLSFHKAVHRLLCLPANSRSLLEMCNWGTWSRVRGGLYDRPQERNIDLNTRLNSHRHRVLAFLSTLSIRVTWCHYWCGCRGSVFSLMSVGSSISDAHSHAYHSFGPWDFRAKKPRQPYSVSTKKEQSLSM